MPRRSLRGTIEHLAVEFHPDHLIGKRLAIAATDKRAVNAWVAHQAERLNIPVNVVDDRELSRFIVPAIVDRSPVIVAVGSSGDAPVLTRRLREKLESFLPQRLGVLAKLAGKLRPAVKAKNRRRERAPALLGKILRRHDRRGCARRSRADADCESLEQRINEHSTQRAAQSMRRR